MWNTRPGKSQFEQTCIFCGLACDDLRFRLNTGEEPVLANGCTKAQELYEEAFAAADAQPSIQGRKALLTDVLDYCVDLLRNSRAPLFGGLVTDVNGMRAILELADRCGAQLDHVNADAMFRNLLVLQDSGWFTTTFAEARNRADLVIVVGTECFEGFPRLIERVLYPSMALFAPPQQRDFVLIGPWGGRALPTEIAALKPAVLEVELHQLAGLSNLLRGLVAGRPVDTEAMTGVDSAPIRALAEKLRRAAYSVLVWSAAELDFPHAELTVQGLVELVRDLNEKTRAAALPLAGTLGDITAAQVCTWQTGYPLRIDLQRGHPRYDPLLNRHQDLLARGETDLLLWTSAVPYHAAPPAPAVPTIVMGHPGTRFAAPPDAFIPVGIPGIDHPGHWYRSDAACPLPLGQMRRSDLPSVGQATEQLTERLGQADRAEGIPGC